MGPLMFRPRARVIDAGITRVRSTKFGLKKRAGGASLSRLPVALSPEAKTNYIMLIHRKPVCLYMQGM